MKVGQILIQTSIHQMIGKNKFIEIPQGIAFAGRKIVKQGENIMLSTLKRLVAKRATTSSARGGKVSKTQKVLSYLSNGKSVSWKELRTKFDLTSPRQMIDKLREAGNMIYINKSAEGTSYRLGTPSKAIIAAGIKALYKNQLFSYNRA